MNAQPTPNALTLYNAVVTRFAPTEQTEPVAVCDCGEPLQDESEIQDGVCWNCQAEAANRDLALRQARGERLLPMEIPA